MGSEWCRIYLPRHSNIHARMIYCTSYYFYVSIIKYIETLIMIITKKLHVAPISFPQSFCNKIAWQKAMSAIYYVAFISLIANQKLNFMCFNLFWMGGFSHKVFWVLDTWDNTSIKTNLGSTHIWFFILCIFSMNKKWTQDKCGEALRNSRWDACIDTYSY